MAGEFRKVTRSELDRVYTLGQKCRARQAKEAAVRILLFIIIMTFSFVLLVRLAFADAPVTWENVIGTGSMKPGAAIATMEKVDSFYRANLGFGLDVRRYEDRDNDYALTSDFARPFWESFTFDHFQSIFRKEGLFNPRRTVILVLPPMRNKFGDWFGGFCFGNVGTRFDVMPIAYCANEPLTCAIPVAHETLHAWGAPHLRLADPNVPNIMDPAAGKFGQKAFVMRHRTKVAVFTHLEKVGYLEFFRRK